ncbi:hydroxymethylglutaryl-CoA lyase [Alkalibacillus haloalkaliphilus]|uniref:Hydroxymethylglutaryl-CoA lyase YngG n=1 Tax=Alkalibacillus haloalkaliphilus TaxID=94136 RepID=A0A511W6R5_9BACI|nr:hydroxymethylglutaryl-CoA lyase [Alkalibacillus haloalkaliphilus]GEN45042.1 hydroxymethylglutaryl-CoA lyase YngG [Alkalibacillus haloalkaliphilus]
MNLSKQVQIKEVGPRDGLQNEKKEIATEDKIEWINRMSESGLSYIEITSFVHPKWIPQLKDAVEVAKSIERKDGVTYAALVPNMKGLERAIEADVDEVSIFMSASESHNKNNINKSISETYPILREVVDEAKKAGKSVRGYVSTVFGCPYEGNVDEHQAIDVCDNLFNMGIDELSIGDTIGVANPVQVERVLSEFEKHFSKDKIALHFHDTRGMALANTVVALQLGYHIFDSALGGLGGCPYAKGASGNVATDDLAHMLQQMGLEQSIDLNKLQEAAQFIESKLDQPLPSKQMGISRRL